VYEEEPELIGVVRGLQEAGKDTCRGRTMDGLRGESGGQAAESKWMNYGSGAGSKIDLVLDTDMVQEAVEVEWPGDILPLVARARCPCYGQPFISTDFT
jgi:hypothetical protein